MQPFTHTSVIFFPRVILEHPYISPSPLFQSLTFNHHNPTISTNTMAERGIQQQGESIRNMLQEKSPSSSQVMSVLALFPVGGILLALSGIILTGTVIGLAVAAPLFLLFSPILVPAAIVIGLAVTGFLTSGAFGLTGVSSIGWILNYLRGIRETVPEGVEHVKRRMGEMAVNVGQRTKDVGQGIQNRAHETTGART